MLQSVIRFIVFDRPAEAMLRNQVRETIEMKTRKIKRVTPRLRRLGPKTRKEVWFEDNTVLSLIAACVEVIEGHGANKDTEMVGLLYGKATKPAKGPRASRYFIKRSYIIQNAKRKKASVNYDITMRRKMNSFYSQAFGDKYLGSFHLHPGGSPRLSRADKRNKFRPGELKFLVFLKEKKLTKGKVNTGLSVKMINDHNELDIRCKVKLKHRNGKSANYYVSFGVRGWYRYNTSNGAWYAPTSIMIA